MMHITDWLPTLYAAAGGDVEDLGERLDGFDLWDALKNNGPSQRKEILHNIDDVYGNSAITVEKWKYVRGMVYITKLPIIQSTKFGSYCY